MGVCEPCLLTIPRFVLNRLFIFWVYLFIGFDFGSLKKYLLGLILGINVCLMSVKFDFDFDITMSLGIIVSLVCERHFCVPCMCVYESCLYICVCACVCITFLFSQIYSVQ